jgi:flagellar basal-body rod protein FlgF
MDRLIYTANSTLTEQSVARQVIMNELANVSTVGFKRSFEVAMTAIKAEGDGFDTRFQPVAVSRDLIRMNAGPVMTTGNPGDVALLGGAVLTVLASNGDMAFTRRGDLSVDQKGQLVNGAGHVVLGEAGPISVPANQRFYITPDGSVYAQNTNPSVNEATTLIGKLRLRDAENLELDRRPDGLFAVHKQPPGTDIPAPTRLLSVIPKALEGSNVNSVEALTKLLDHARSFESQVRVMKDMKSLDESGSSMMKLA